MPTQKPRKRALPLPLGLLLPSFLPLAPALVVYQGPRKRCALGELNADNGIVGVRLGRFVMTTRSASRASTFGRGL